MPGLGDAGGGKFDLGVEHVAGDLEEGWARRAVMTFAERHRHHVGDARRRRHGGGELGDRLEDVDMGQVLERAHLVLAERALAADQQHRTFGAKGVGDAGDGVGGAGAGGDDGAAGLAALA